MPVEDRKDTIAFIICVNNELYFEECRYYIEHLEVSAGYDIDVIGIWEADSMCAAYNLGMRSSDAKYKVYMHQDVFIRDSRFLEKTLRIFKEHPKTGMIGMAGGIGIPENGIAVNVHYIPVYYHPYYQEHGFKEVHCPVAEEVYSHIISLPVYPGLTDEQQDTVIETVKRLTK